MERLTNYQIINDADGHPAFAVIPYKDFVRTQAFVPKDGVPHAVVSAAVDGQPMLQAWREYLMLTQEEIASRMGITQAGYAQIEAAKRPRKKTLEKAAAAMGITLEQLAY
ncbi:helix-turn-helix transcriptional regulator [Nitrosomonas communis]|uniref:helix-turn-helix domain-containing protein n=1 Tax=Nitrosomonas communis TaxID=44574 RepID=UPI0026EC95DA|nr:helix-turn-helix transcriptional regulator [Nitrosomonas communis]MCO6428899.1 helix-turn-helix transcriptional regulator [Nitrosomonas communis]